MNPPRAAELLLLAIAGDAQAEFVAGDLAEDFGSIFARRGPRTARRWYVWQVLRSLPALLGLRIRSGEFTAAALRAVFGVLLPLVALDRLWRFVYSQVPLKDGAGRAPGMLLANILLVMLCSWLAGGSGRRRPGPEILAALAAAALAIGTAAAAAPAIYVLGLLLAAPAHSLWALGRSKWRRNGSCASWRFWWHSRS
jgi:hypothetical protein